jgi:hypothetical protein
MSASSITISLSLLCAPCSGRVSGSVGSAAAGTR